MFSCFVDPSKRSPRDCLHFFLPFISDYCLQVEKSLSSKHRLPKGPRVIDVDILLYENQVVTDQKLTIPHPKFHLRRFALTPAAEIVGGIFHPVLGKSISNLLTHCKDRAEVVQVI